MARTLQRLLDNVRDSVGTGRAVENARRSLVTEERVLAAVDALGHRLTDIDARASRRAA
jgi:hypothetical protein